MKKIIYVFIFLVLLLNSSIIAQDKFIIGAGGNYNLPVGTMADRMQGNFGGWFYAGKQVSDKWTWVGKLEYFKLTEVNSEQMFKIVETEISGTTQQLKFPLPGIKMEFTSVGLTAEAKYKLLKTDFFDTDLNLGFGFYYWEYFRDAFQDSLFADSSGNGDLILVDAINTPSLRQKDWSGGLNIGLDFNVNLFEPVFLNLSANYKIIIAELWPTLDLNLENVSGLQFVDFRAGINLRL